MKMRINMNNSAFSEHIALMSGEQNIVRTFQTPLRFIRKGVYCRAKTGGQKNILAERHRNGIIVGLNIRSVYRAEVVFHQCSLHTYINITKLELGYPVSTDWLFSWISQLPRLEFICFGSRFFEKCDEVPISEKIGDSPSVRNFEIRYGTVEHEKKDKISKSEAMAQLQRLLDLAATHFTGLNFVNFDLPRKGLATLNTFLKRVPEIRKTGVKFTYCGQEKIVRFRTRKALVRVHNEDGKENEPMTKAFKIDAKMQEVYEQVDFVDHKMVISSTPASPLKQLVLTNENAYWQSQGAGLTGRFQPLQDSSNMCFYY